ncbi:hypothetical protein Tco_0608394 [Tanacetum coccineum]
MMTARKRVRSLPVQQLGVRHCVDHSSSDYFSPDDSARDSSSDSSSEASSDFHSDASFDSSSRHSLSDHSSPDLPSTSARPSRKRHRSPMTPVPVLPPVSGALSSVYADLIPSPKMVKDSGYSADVEVDPKKTSLRDDVIESETGARGPVKARVERDTHPVMPEDTPEPTQEERAVECTYETLGSLVQRFHDHTEAIPVHRIQVIGGVQREQGCRIVGVKSAVTALTERIAELERDNRRLRGTARKAAMNLEPLNENGDEQEGGNEGNGGNRGNENGGNGENGNRNRNRNHGMNYGGFMLVARECTFQDFLKCKPHNFSGTEGINSHKRTIGVDATYVMKWAGLMRLMTEVYCLRNEIQKMETELWNMTVKGNDLTA